MLVQLLKFSSKKNALIEFFSKNVNANYSFGQKALKCK